MIFRSLFETTFSAGTFKSSDNDSAKLSPTQLNSGLSDVFSNGKTITTSAARCAWVAKLVNKIRRRTTDNFNRITSSTSDPTPVSTTFGSGWYGASDNQRPIHYAPYRPLPQAVLTLPNKKFACCCKRIG
jgi:hypothetical protein